MLALSRRSCDLSDTQTLHETHHNHPTHAHCAASFPKDGLGHEQQCTSLRSW